MPGIPECALWQLKQRLVAGQVPPCCARCWELQCTYFPDGGQLQLLCGLSPCWQSCVLLLLRSDHQMVPELGRTGLLEAHLWKAVQRALPFSLARRSVSSLRQAASSCTVQCRWLRGGACPSTGLISFSFPS